MTIKRAKVPKLLGAASHVSSPRTFIFVAVVHVQFFFQKKKKTLKWSLVNVYSQINRIAWDLALGIFLNSVRGTGF